MEIVRNSDPCCGCQFKLTGSANRQDLSVLSGGRFILSIADKTAVAPGKLQAPGSPTHSRLDFDNSHIIPSNQASSFDVYLFLDFSMTDPRSRERETGRETPRTEPKYEVYVRLPFNRGGFVDPPPVSVMSPRLIHTVMTAIHENLTPFHQVDWDDSKSDALWNIISEVERTERKIDCKWHFAIAGEFWY